MIPEILGCFESTLTFMQGQVADLSDAEMVLQPPSFPNHAAWTLGHVVSSCQAIAAEFGVGPWLPSDWESHFGSGSSPVGAVSELSSKPTMLAALADASDRLRTALMAIDESVLTKPLPDERVRKILPTLGRALVQVLAAHTAFHARQLAAWRRAIGRAPGGSSFERACFREGTWLARAFYVLASRPVPAMWRACIPLRRNRP
jgi:hypothetical protein